MAMERRRDYRLVKRYPVSLKRRGTHVILDGLSTRDVSASGLSFETAMPHGLREGDRLEVRLRAPVGGYEIPAGTLEMGTDAVVVRTDERTAALRFEAPLSY